MYFLSWIILGLITGSLTGQLLAGGGYGPIIEGVDIAGVLPGGRIVCLSGITACGYGKGSVCWRRQASPLCRQKRAEELIWERKGPSWMWRPGMCNCSEE